MPLQVYDDEVHGRGWNERLHVQLIAVERQEHWRLAVRTHLVQPATLRAGQYLALVGTFHFVAEAKA